MSSVCREPPRSTMFRWGEKPLSRIRILERRDREHRQNPPRSIKEPSQVKFNTPHSPQPTKSLCVSVFIPKKHMSSILRKILLKCFFGIKALTQRKLQITARGPDSR